MTYQYDTIDKIKAAQDRGAVIEEATGPNSWAGSDKPFEFWRNLQLYRVISDPMFPDGPDGRVEWSLYTTECGPVRLDGSRCYIKKTYAGLVVLTSGAIIHADEWHRISFSPPCTNQAETSTQANDVSKAETDARISELEAQLAKATKATKVVDAAVNLFNGAALNYQDDIQSLRAALKDNGYLEE